MHFKNVVSGAKSNLIFLKPIFINIFHHFVKFFGSKNKIKYKIYEEKRKK